MLDFFLGDVFHCAHVDRVYVSAGYPELPENQASQYNRGWNRESARIRKPNILKKMYIRENQHEYR